MKNLIAVVLLVFALSAEAFAQQTAIQPAKTGVNYGLPIKNKGAIPVKQLISNLSKTDQYTGKVEGKVTQVCKMKGCWLALETADGTPPVTVRFKDYGFFVPQDLVGKHVVIEGYAKVKDKEDKNEPGKTAKDITFTADGVLVVK